jgi:hypothetical protein
VPAITLRERVRAASGSAPLCALSAAQREELDRELEVAESIEDLPGKWQAALLEAELGPRPGGGHCRSR